MSCAMPDLHDLGECSCAVPEVEHGLWCPPDCSCAQQDNEVVSLIRQIGDPEVAREYLRSDLADRLMHGTGALHRFLVSMWPEIESAEYEDTEAARAICDHVQTQLEERAYAMRLDVPPKWWRGKQRAQDLLIRVPPRNLKSIIVSVCAPAWAWLRWPSLVIGSLCANPRVTTTNAFKFRKIIASDRYQNLFRPTWHIDGKRDSLELIANSAGGSRTSLGLMSKVQGDGYHWIIVDDPHDGDEVYSKAKRAQVHSKWDNALSTRFIDPRYTIRTGIMQGLHYDDWGEHRIAEGWGLLLIRMCYEPSRPRKRYPTGVVVETDDIRVSPYGWRDWRRVPGETINPARFSQAYVEQERRNPLKWAAQQQHDPAGGGSGIINEDQLCEYETLPSRFDAMLLSVDASFLSNTGKTGSRVSITAWGRVGDDRFLVDNDTRGMDLTETIRAIRAMVKKYPQTKRCVLVEKAANGHEVIKTLSGEFRIVPIHVSGKGSKEGCLMACQPQFAARHVYVPQYAPWKADYVAELTQFPNWDRDDQVDSTSQALNYWSKSTSGMRAAALCRF